MNLFYTPNIQGDFALFEEDEARHITQVLRKKEGEPLFIVDGKGGFYECIIAEATKRTCVAQIQKRVNEYKKRPYHIHIAVAPTKNIDRLEWFLEKATEIGIDEVTPLLCEHSERTSVRIDRLNNVLVAAMKQSLQAFLPKLNDLTKFKDFVHQTTEAQRFIAHCVENEDKKTFAQVFQQQSSYQILIGPEGDFSEKEIDWALKNNFTPISLGENRLRTETAALVACQWVHFLKHL